MKRNLILTLGCIVFTAVFLGGCVSQLAPPVEDSRFIAVTGNGKAIAEPDTAEFTVGVEQIADTAQQAQEETNRIANAIAEALKALGVLPEDMQTSSISLWTEEVRPDDMYGVYDVGPSGSAPSYPAATPNPVSGAAPGVTTRYRASVNIRVKTKDLDGLGALLSAATEAGSNQLYGIQFSLEDDSASYQEAITAALANAEAKAEQIAAQTGMRLGIIEEVTEQSFSSPVLYKEASLAGGVVSNADAVAVSIESGSLTVTASVAVKYAMLG